MKILKNYGSKVDSYKFRRNTMKDDMKKVTNKKQTLQVKYKNYVNFEPGNYLAEISKVAPTKLKGGKKGVKVTFDIKDESFELQKLTVTYPLVLKRNSSLHKLVSQIVPAKMCGGEIVDLYTLVGKLVFIFISRQGKHSDKTYICEYCRYIPDETVCGYADTAEPGVYPAELYSLNRQDSSLEVTFRFQDAFGNIVMIPHFLIKDGIEDVLCERFKKSLGIEALSSLNIQHKPIITITVNKNSITDFDAPPQKQDSMEPGCYIAVIESIEKGECGPLTEWDEDGFEYELDDVCEFDWDHADITFQQKDGRFYTISELILERGDYKPLWDKLKQALIPEGISEFSYSDLETKKIIVTVDNEKIVDVKKYIPSEKERTSIKFGYWEP